MALASMARLVLGASYRAASDGSFVASARLSPVLDLEKPTSHWPPVRAARCPGVDTRDGHGEPVVGRTQDSWGASEIGDLGKSVDRRQIPASPSTSAVPNVADVPHQSREPSYGHRSLRRTDGHIPAALRPRHPGAQPTTDRPRGGHRASNSSLDGTAAFATPFQRTTRLGVCFTIAIRSLQTSPPPSP